MDAMFELLAFQFFLSGSRNRSKHLIWKSPNYKISYTFQTDFRNFFFPFFSLHLIDMSKYKFNYLSQGYLNPQLRWIILIWKLTWVKGLLHQNTMFTTCALIYNPRLPDRPQNCRDPRCVNSTLLPFLRLLDCGEGSSYPPSHDQHCHVSESFSGVFNLDVARCHAAFKQN